MKAVILAAGKSTRTYPLTLTRPKPLLPLANKPILAHQLEALAGIVESVVIVVGYRRDMIEERFGNNFAGLSLRYVEQTEQRGTGHALLHCADVIREPMLAMNGDDLYAPEDLKTLAAMNSGGLATRVEDPSRFGIYTFDGDRVTGIVEKPAREKSKSPAMNVASIGAYKFPPDVFDVLRRAPESPRGEIEITAAIQAYAERGCFSVAHAAGYWLPIGYPWDLLAANEYMLKHMLAHDVQGEVSPLADISGVVQIGKGTIIKAGAVIEGPVCIGQNSVIGPNCWIRPGCSIGDRCKAGQGVEIKNSILFDGAAVPHLSYVGDSIVGENSNLGCGTITANFRHDGKNHSSMVKGVLVDTGRRKLGAIIGDNVHTGINTSIYPGRKLWPGTSTLPGEVVQRDKEL